MEKIIKRKLPISVLYGIVFKTSRKKENVYVFKAIVEGIAMNVRERWTVGKKTGDKLPMF